MENWQNKDSWQQMSIWGTKRFLIFNYLLLKDRKRVYTFFDQREHKMYEWLTLENFESEGINNFDSGPEFIPNSKVQLGDKEYLVSWIDAYKLKSSTPKYPEKKKELEQLANSLDENDNPVLMLVKLKE